MFGAVAFGAAAFGAPQPSTKPGAVTITRVRLLPDGWRITPATR